jgi:hypothetical protein
VLASDSSGRSVMVLALGKLPRNVALDRRGVLVAPGVRF